MNKVTEAQIDRIMEDTTLVVEVFKLKDDLQCENVWP